MIKSYKMYVYANQEARTEAYTIVEAVELHCGGLCVLIVEGWAENFMMGSTKLCIFPLPVSMQNPRAFSL